VSGAGLEELVNGKPNISGDFPKKGRSDIPALVKGHRGTPAIGMPELFMGAPLANLYEAKRLENGNDLVRLEDGHSHGLTHL
jgi:hypothetical protein